MTNVRMRLHFWKPAVVHLSRDLYEVVRRIHEQGNINWFSIVDVLERLDGNSPLVGEAERLYSDHGEFYFRFSE